MAISKQAENLRENRMCEDWPYGNFPEDHDEDLAREYQNEDLDDDFWDEFPEEDDWEDEEEFMIENGG